MPTGLTTDILFLREEKAPWKALEDRVREAAAEKGYKFDSQPLKTDITAPVIFYAPFDASYVISTQPEIATLRRRNPDSAIVVVYNPDVEEVVRREVQMNNVHAFSGESSSEQVKQLLSDFEGKHLMHPQQISPLALVVAENGGAKYQKILARAGFKVECVEKQDIRAEDFGHYAAHQIDFNLILLEGRYISSLSDRVGRLFPSAMVIGIGGTSQKRVAYNKGVAVFLPNDVAPDHTLEKLESLARRRYRAQVGLLGRTGKCYLLAGPSCSGKTEAGYQIQEDFRGDEESKIIMIQKHTTRKPRTGEEPGVHFQFVTDDEMISFARGRKYFMIFKVSGHKYGIPRQLVDLLNEGHDTVMTLTDIDTIPRIVDELNKIRPGTAVPVMIYADSPTLKARLLERPAPVEELKRRIATLDSELEKVLRRSDKFKYAINTGVSSPDEVKRILKAVVQWERYHSGENYAEYIASRVLPQDFAAKVVRGQEVFLTIPDEVVATYAEQNGILVDDISHLQRQRVVCAPNSYGRRGIFLEPLRDMHRLNARSTSLDLIEMAIGLEPRARSDFWYHAPVSIFAKCGDSNTKFNDGLLYMRGDDISDRPAFNQPVYAIAFGYARSKGGYTVSPVRERELEFWNNFTSNTRRFPFTARGNMPLPKRPRTQ